MVTAGQSEPAGEREPQQAVRRRLTPEQQVLVQAIVREIFWCTPRQKREVA